VTDTARPYASPDRWREVRRRLDAHRHALADPAARHHPGLPRVGSTCLLHRAGWVPRHPIELHRIALEWDDAASPAQVGGGEPAAAGALPAGFATYAEAMAALARPRLFENRVCYRLLDVSWPVLRFTRGRYFDGVNVGEAAAHEFAAADLAARGRPGPGVALPFRSLVGDPTDLRRRAALLAVSMLTVRRDRRTGEASFVLHWRDPARVAHGGGLYQVMPVGVFQPVDDSTRAERAGLDLWTCVVREYAEEFLGRAETYGEDFDHETWPLYRWLTDARETGSLRSFVLGLGVDPLTFATDLLAVTVLDADLFDEVFGDLVTANEEGRVVGARGIPFDADAVRRYAHHEPMQPAGAAVLELAWHHRSMLLA
jgi:hypothetical protein